MADTSDYFPLPETKPVPLSRFQPEVVEILELVTAAEMPDGDIWAMGRDGASYRFPLTGEAFADALLAWTVQREAGLSSEDRR